ncbi:Na/Pi cotransporter family protein [Aerococcaceae bacterium NML130460]|nr:Na/Pi cotransporter family protein [Aerococcaceae bacterium NML130460]
MELANFFALLGGLALFLYGMNMMSNGLEIVAGNRMKSILEKLTANRFVGVGIGALMTALVQSSSAITVMTVGFVNSGLMGLENAVWVIMGANVGTTITGQLIAIDITTLAPLIAFSGVSLIAFFKSQRLDGLGTVLAGLGFLFMGMAMMSGAMVPLRTVPEFVNLITSFENPFIGIVVGALFTAVIQSSSASVGILQALAVSGVITLPSALFVLFGQNIGTCITSVIASIGTNRNAKRATAIHLAFNIIGTAFFVGISLVTPFASIMVSLTPTNVPAQIANVHTVFNVVTTILLLPFGYQLVKFACWLLPEEADEKADMTLKFLDFKVFDNDYRIGASAVANAQLFREVQNMLSVVIENTEQAFRLFRRYDDEIYETIEKNEEYIDYLNQGIIRFTTLTLSFELPVSGTQAIGLFVKVSSDLERIGDHAMNIAERAKALAEEGVHFSDKALAEVEEMKSLVRQVLQELSITDYSEFDNLVKRVDEMENLIDDTYLQFEQNQLVRLKDKQCTVQNSIHYAKILTDFERIGDHALNIANSFDEIQETVQSMKLLHESLDRG